MMKEQFEERKKRAFELGLKEKKVKKFSSAEVVSCA